MLTEQEIQEALLKAKAEEAKKTEQSQVSPEIQKQLDALTKLVQSQESEKSKQQDLTAEQSKAQEASQLKAEADIKKMLSVKSDDTDYDSLSNKEILEIVASAFETSIDAKTKIATAEASKPFEELNKQIGDIRKYLLQQEAKTGIDAARSKFSDFDEYKDDIFKIFDKYPGMAPKDAYILAKGNKAAGSPSQKTVESERPVSLGTRAAEAEKRYDKGMRKDKETAVAKSSMAGFRDALAAAVDKTVSVRNR